MIITQLLCSQRSWADRIRLIAIEMEGAFGNEGALPLSTPRLDFSYAIGVVIAGC